MYNFPPSKETKANREKPLEQFSYQSTLDWKFMKKLKSETEVRHWHVKVHIDKYNERGKPIYEDFNIHQVWFRQMGERLTAYRATKSGRAIDIRQPLFVKEGEDWLHGVEYLLRVLEGQDVTNLDLRKQQELS